MTINGARLASMVLTALASATARTLALALVAWVAARVLGRSGAAVRLRLWTFTLYAALLLPLAAVLIPVVTVPLPDAVASRLQWMSATDGLSGTTRAVLGNVGIGLAGRHGAAGSKIDGTDAGIAAPAASTPTSDSSMTRWMELAAVVYAAGVCFLLLRAGAGWFFAWRFHRRVVLLRDHAAIAVVARQARLAGVSPVPPLAIAAGLRVPVTLSVIAPTIVLPRDWRRWTPGTLELVVAHEMSHIARGDAWTQRLSLIYRAVAWCNPFSWWLRARLAELSELASDEAVLEQGADSGTYAETLLGFFSAIRHEPRRIAWHIAMARGADASAERRVNNILDWKGGRSMKLSRAIVLGLLLAAVTIAALTASVPVQQAVAVKMPDPAGVAAPAPVPLPAQMTAPTVALPFASAPEPNPAPTPAPHPAPISAPSTMPAPSVLTSTPSVDPRDADFPAMIQDVVKPGNGVTAPIPIRRADPKYTADAMDRKLQGDVEMDVVVLKNGTVGDVTVTKSLDPVLDRQAIIAAKQWVFKPGMKDGQPVDVLVGLMIEFRLHDGPPLPEDFAAGAYAIDTKDLVAPVVIRKEDPKYTSDAMRAKMQGDVTLDVIVMPDGSVGKVRVTKSLDTQFGLDAKAIEAAKNWRFTPGELNGEAVRVVMSITLEFRLH